MNCPAVFIYSDCIYEESRTRPSPTSSLRGVFSPSRPASYAPSECPSTASECPTISRFTTNSSDYSSDVSTPATGTTDDALHMSFKSSPKPQDSEPTRVSTADEIDAGLAKPKAIPVSSEVKSSSKILLSRTVHTFLQKKSRIPKSKTQFAPHEIDVEVSVASPGLDHAEDTPSRSPGKSKHHSWHAIQRTVSHFLHRDPKERGTGKKISLPSSAQAIPITISSPRALKPSKSASLKPKSSSTSIVTQHSRRSAKRLTITPPPHVFAEQQAKALACKRLHRPRSFSGYPNVLAAIADECSDVDTDVGLDEATMEAKEVMKGIQRKLACARIEGVGREGGPDEIMFERGVEPM